MNYAALIAILAALAFALPFLVRLAEGAGVPRGFSMMTTLAAAIFALAWVIVRSRVMRRSAVEERVGLIEAQRLASPESPEAFFLHGEHLGDLLLTLGRQREALAAFEAYRRVAHGADARSKRVEGAILELRRELSREELDASV